MIMFYKSITPGGVHRRSAIKYSQFEKIKIYLPLLQEQKKITNVLFAIQNSKEKTYQYIKALKELKNSFMKHLFTYGPVSINEAKKIKMKDTEIAKINEKYKVVLLKDMVESYRNGIYKKVEFYGSGYPCIRMYNIVNGKINTDKSPLLNVTAKELDMYCMKKGDLLINRVNSSELVGKAGILLTDIGPATFESKNIRVRLNKDIIFPEYISYYVQSPFYTEQIRLMIRAAVSQVTINQDDLNRIWIILPPLLEQRKISDILSSLDKKIEIEENKKKALDELFKSMLYNLMTAKIRVNNVVMPNAE